MNLKYLFIVFLLLPVVICSQDLSKYYKKIEMKIEKDKKYLNAFTVNVTPTPELVSNFQDIPLANGREVFNFEIKDGVNYFILFLNETVDTDSLILLAVKKTEDKSATGQGLFDGVSNQAQIDTLTVLGFRDIQELYFNQRTTYEKLVSLVYEIIDEDEPSSVLGIKIEDNVNKSKGVSGKNNQDFLNFAWANSIHQYPKPEPKNKVSLRRKSQQTTASPYRLDVSLGNISFFNSSMDMGFSQYSAEISTSDKLLNMHPWQSATLSGGIRSLIFLSQDMENIFEDYIIDAKLLGRVRVNTSSIAKAFPNIFVDPPKLNVGSGMILDISTTRTYGLPFLNMYFASGSENLENPYFTSGRRDSSVAYFSFTQWASYFSFYWNSSDDLTLRFRMDIGAGGYDVVKAVYYNGVKRDLVFNKIQPVITFNMNFVPKSKELFAASLRYFDSIMKIDFWLTLLNIEPYHNVRFEASFFTSPFYRSVRPWENEGSTMVSLRYRYGF